MDRREFCRALAAGGAAMGLPSLSGCAGSGEDGPVGRVVVIGGGFAGATAAKYLRMWSPEIEVTLVERNSEFVSCSLSNLVIGGRAQIGDLATGYGALSRTHGVAVIRDEAVAIDPVAHEVRLATGRTLGYDRLVVAPGIDFIYDDIPGLASAEAQSRVLHAWKAGAQTVALRRQLEAMPDGGVYVLCIPEAPFRCPSAPYERVCQVAAYFRRSKPGAKIIVFDANPDIVAGKRVFSAAWNGPYYGLIEYVPGSELVDVDSRTLTAKLKSGDVRADVLNVIPAQKAGKIAHQAGLVAADHRWCAVDFLTYESLAHRRVHVLGDAALLPAGMPRSGHIANQQGRLCADAIVALATGGRINDAPMLAYTGYSFVDEHDAAFREALYQYDRDSRTMVTVFVGDDPELPARVDGDLAFDWVRSIWADALL